MSVRNPLKKTSRLLVEHLEQRMMLHAGHVHLPDTLDADAGAPTTEQLELAATLGGNAMLDPHVMDDGDYLPPIDFDALLGIPNGRAGSIELPDFFPDISSIGLDQTSQSGRTLVRFSTYVNNQGNGPAILLSGRPGTDPIPTGAPITSWVNEDGSHNVLQGVYSFNGSSYSLSHYRAAGRVTYHPGHGHFHYDGYAGYRLRENVGGQPGDYVQRPDGTGIVGEKVGFCLINLSSSFTMENGQSSTSLPGYNRPGQPSTGCGLLQGVHVGKADIYSSGISGQWLDVTGIPNGQYFIEIDLDDSDVVLESNEDNNARTFAFNLNANPPSGGIQPDIYDTPGHNNTFEAATDLGVLGTFTQTGLTVHWGLDHDYFKFEASSSGQYTVTATAANGDINIYMFDDTETLVASSTKPSGVETISYNFVKGQTYYLRAQTYNSSTSSNYQLAWNLKPEASSATDFGIAAEGGPAGKFIIARNGPVNNPLTVTYTMSGDAVNGVDYQMLSGSVTIGNLDSQAVIDVEAIVDGIEEGPESVILTITSGNAYVVGATGSQMLITDVSPDFDGDQSLGLADLDLLTQAIASQSPRGQNFDLTGDSVVDTDDLALWLQMAGAVNLPSGNAYLPADANLDGRVDGADFLVWNMHKFQSSAKWSEGDFNADGQVDGGDFLLWNANKFVDVGARGAYVAPLPSQSTREESSALRQEEELVDVALCDPTGSDDWFLQPPRR